MRGGNPEKGVILTRKRVYIPSLPSTYKETGISDDLNDGMEWVFKDYKRYLNKTKNPYHLGTTWWSWTCGIMQRS